MDRVAAASFKNATFQELAVAVYFPDALSGYVKDSLIWCCMREMAA